MTATELEAQAKADADRLFWAWTRGECDVKTMLDAHAQHDKLRTASAWHQAQWEGRE